MIDTMSGIAVGAILLATFFLTGGSYDGLIGVAGGGLSVFMSFAFDLWKQQS